MKLHQNVIDACLTDYQKGLLVPAIALRRGVSVASIYGWIKERNVPLRGWENPDEVKAKAVKDYLNNVPLKKIAEKYGICKTSVYRWSKKRNNLRSYDEKKQRRVLADYVLGLPIEDILEKHTINKKTLIKWRHDYGIPSLRRRDYQ